jgi:hypothetical protein
VTRLDVHPQGSICASHTARSRGTSSFTRRSRSLLYASVVGANAGLGERSAASPANGGPISSVCLVRPWLVVFCGSPNQGDRDHVRCRRRQSHIRPTLGAQLTHEPALSTRGRAPGRRHGALYPCTPKIKFAAGRWSALASRSRSREPCCSDAAEGQLLTSRGNAANGMIPSRRFCVRFIPPSF